MERDGAKRLTFAGGEPIRGSSLTGNARGVAAVVFIVIVATSGALASLDRALGMLGPGSEADRTAWQESRLEPLRAFLPQRGVVGYISDGLDGRSFRSLTGMQDFFAAQYALAPVILAPDARGAPVVGHFADSASLAGARAAGRFAGRAVLHDLGNGVVLLEAER